MSYLHTSNKHFTALERVSRPLSLMAAACLLGAWLIPNHYLPWPAFYNDLSAAIALLMLAIVTSIHIDIRTPIILTRTALILLLIITIPLLQLLTGLIAFAGDAWITSLYLSGLALAYVLGYQLGGQFRVKLFQALAWLFLLGSLISVFLAFHQWLQLDSLGIWLADLRFGGRAYANLAQPNNLATLLFLGLISSLYLYETEQLRGIFTSLLIVCLLAGIALTGSRTPFVVAIVLTGWILWGRNRPGLKISATHIILGLLAFAFFWWALPALADAMYLSIPGIAERSQSSLRLVIWSRLLDAVMNAPWFGYGWNQVSFAQIAVATSLPPLGVIEHSHNIVLDLLLWNGVIIGGALITALSWWLFTRLKHCPSKDSWFGLAVIMIVGTHGLLEYPLEYAYFLLPIGLCIGAVDRSYPQTQIKIPGWTLAASTLIGWMLIIGVFIEYKSVEHEHHQMRLQMARIGYLPVATQTSEPNIFSQLSSFIKYARTLARENMTEDELDWMQKVAHRYPYPPALFRYALALGLNHRYDEAGLELVRLKRLHPQQHIEEALMGWQFLTKLHPQLKQVSLP